MHFDLGVLGLRSSKVYILGHVRQTGQKWAASNMNATNEGARNIGLAQHVQNNWAYPSCSNQCRIGPGKPRKMSSVSKAGFTRSWVLNPFNRATWWWCNHPAFATMAVCSPHRSGTLWSKPKGAHNHPPAPIHSNTICHHKQPCNASSDNLKNTHWWWNCENLATIICIQYSIQVLIMK